MNERAVRLTVLLSERDRDALAAIAAEDGMSAADAYRIAIREYVQRRRIREGREG